MHFIWLEEIHIGEKRRIGESGIVYIISLVCVCDGVGIRVCLPSLRQGENNCAAGGNPCCPNGFTAAPGFDPLSGLGSVNFGQLLKVLVAM